MLNNIIFSSIIILAFGTSIFAQSTNNAKNNVIQLEQALVTAESVDIAKEVIGKLISKRSAQQILSKTIQCSTYVKSSYQEGDDLSLLEFLSYSSYKRPGEYRDFIVAIDDHSSDDKDFSINVGFAIEIGGDDVIPSQGEFNIGQHFYQGYGDGNIDLFSNTISLPKIIANKIPSPLSFDAFLNYKFKLRSIAGQPGNFTYHIEFESKKRNFIKGILKIQQDGWILEESILEPHKTSLFDLDGLKITQKYIQSISGASLVNERYFDWYLKSDTGSIKVIHSDFILNENLSRKKLGLAIRSYAENAYDIDDSDWSNLRKIPLAIAEKAFVSKQDSLILYFDSDQYVDSVDAFVNKLHWYEPLFSGISFRSRKKGYRFYLDPLINQFNPAGIGGWRQQVGSEFRRIFKNDKRLTFSGYANYGYANQDLRGELSVNYLYNPKSFKELELAVGDDYMMINTYESILGTFARRNFARRQFINLMHRFELINGLFVRLTYDYSKRSSISNLTLNSSWDDLLGEINPPQYFPDYTVSIAGIEIQYRHRQRYIMKKNRKLLLGSKYPTIALEYRKGIPKWLGSDVNYNLLRVNAFDHIQWPRLGYSNWSVGAGSFLGSNLDSIRFIEHKFFRGSDQYLFSNPINSFQALDSTYHTARSYIELYGIHHFQGALFQQIPLLNIINFEIAVGGSALYIPSLNKTQIETFFGLEKPFKFFDGMLRYGFYYVMTPGSPIPGGFRIKIGIDGYDRYSGKWGY
jgi:hypothetical protein